MYKVIKIAVVCALLTACKEAEAGTDTPEKLLSNGKTIENTLGVTSSGGYYEFDDMVSCMEDGANRVRQTGSRVLKLWLSDQTMAINPYNTDWSRFTIRDCVDLLRTDYYRATLDKDFSAFILVTHTFDTRLTPSNVVWGDGMDSQETMRVEQEMYDVAKYLMQNYNGTGKEFVLENWEGDNMLVSNAWRYDMGTGCYYRAGEAVTDENDAAIRRSIGGLTDWFNARQRGVDKAREEMKGSSDVLVRHALEVNFTCLSDREAPYPYHDSPILIKTVVPFTDCDLYSYSCWSTMVMTTAGTMTCRLEQYETAIGNTYTDIYDGDKVKLRRPLTRPGQKTRIMLGEYGGPERLQGSEEGRWAEILSWDTDRRQRKSIQIQTEAALDYGVEFAVFWEIYCNVPRVDTDPPVSIDMRGGERATSNEQMQGSWLIRVDGSYTQSWLFLHGLLDKDAFYVNEPFEVGQLYHCDGVCGGFEVRYTSTSSGQAVIISGSADGKSFTEIETDLFNSGGEVVMIGRTQESEKYSYFRIEVEKDVKVNGVKFYKSLPEALKKS